MAFTDDYNPLPALVLRAAVLKFSAEALTYPSQVQEILESGADGCAVECLLVSSVADRGIGLDLAEHVSRGDKQEAAAEWAKKLASRA